MSFPAPAGPHPSEQTETSPKPPKTPRRLAHEWVVAATVAVDEATAKHANFRQSFRAEAGQRIDALEVYCGACRRPMDQVGDRPCEAKIDNTHLIGGHQETRAKRLVGNLADGTTKAVIHRPTTVPTINRRGVAAVVSGDA